MIEQKLKRELCNKLNANGFCKEYDVIKHSYSTNRMGKLENAVEREWNICSTLTTRPDCLGVVVEWKEK